MSTRREKRHGSNASNDVGDLIGLALWRWGRRSPRRFAWVAGRTWKLGLAELRRRRLERRIGAPVPWVVAVSPTMTCNYSCSGCYSRGRPEDGELSEDELDSLLSEAEEYGVLAVVLTGGEPLLVDGLVDTIARHQRLLFVLITNGSLVTPETAHRVVECGNVIPLVSIEGFPCDTDGRRRPGAHETALDALERFRAAGACFGFAAMNTAVNAEHIASDEFLGGMESAGCALGFVTEYVPCDPLPEAEWLVSTAVRDAFRERVLDQRARRRTVLIQFPHDEYGADNRCTAAGRASLHISSRGDVEPCPFVPVSRENVREGGLVAAFRSPFLRAIRGRPELLRRERLACSLFEHRAELEAMADELARAR
jgi:MoaA/NifB/PqqE/SkfB family radical SAM enzyme